MANKSVKSSFERPEAGQVQRKIWMHLNLLVSGGKAVKTFISGNIGCKDKISSWDLNRFPNVCSIDRVNII